MISVIVPVARPQKIPALLQSLRDSEREVALHPFLVVSRGDKKSLRACIKTRVPYGISETVLGPGDFAAKLHLGYCETDDPWIFQAAEDITFQPGWADEAIRVAEATGALVIGTNDEGNPAVIRGNHSTHSLIARSYCDDPGASLDGPGTVFSRAYGHQFVDNELVGLARARRVWAFAHRSVVTHNHPSWGKSEMDDIYLLGQKNFEGDRQIFMQRRREWTHATRRRHQVRQRTR
jgi:hypothetical protein